MTIKLHSRVRDTVTSHVGEVVGGPINDDAQPFVPIWQVQMDSGVVASEDGQKGRWYPETRLEEVK